jgi:phosphorylcholine metabolism protein LicD
MLFFLATPEYNNIQSNTTKVKVHLRNGVAEILDQHQDLMGKVENNLLEIETNFENKLEKLIFVLQDAVFIVSNKGLQTNIESQNTGVYVYAKRVREINSATSIDEIVKQYDQKNSTLETEIAKLDTETNSAKLNSRIFLLKEEVEFLRRVVTIVKGLKA